MRATKLQGVYIHLFSLISDTDRGCPEHANSGSMTPLATPLPARTCTPTPAAATTATTTTMNTTINTTTKQIFLYFLLEIFAPSYFGQGNIYWFLCVW